MKIDNLNVYYDKIHALQGISFDVAQGEIVTLIGANGAGKSTTLRAISRLIPIAAGRLFFNGEEITSLKPHLIVEKGISHVPEGRRIFSELSVKENLIMGAYTRKNKDEIQNSYELVLSHFPRLKERISQNAGTLSGGEQQMLAIGRALMSKPQLLLLDEPSMGLSPKLVEDIYSIIVDINKIGTTILLVEQNAQIALTVANRGYVIETGVIKLTGKVEDLMNNNSVREAYLGSSDEVPLTNLAP